VPVAERFNEREVGLYFGDNAAFTSLYIYEYFEAERVLNAINSSVDYSGL
jgi:hypothetical protein